MEEREGVCEREASMSVQQVVKLFRLTYTIRMLGGVGEFSAAVHAATMPARNSTTAAPDHNGITMSLKEIKSPTACTKWR